MTSTTSLPGHITGQVVTPGDPDYEEARRVHNFMIDRHDFLASADDQRRVRENYGAGYDRLAQIKRRYDPANLFHLNQHITPATG